jgi:hypothetical protein
MLSNEGISREIKFDSKQNNKILDEASTQNLRREYCTVMCTEVIKLMPACEPVTCRRAAPVTSSK